MGSRYDEIRKEDIDFIQAQHLFFVSTAANEGSINLSPKGRDTLRIVSSERVVWLNLTGSGNETSAHLQENGRITIMFCSFGDKPLILRLYGFGKVIHPHDAEWSTLYGDFVNFPSARQIIDCKISAVQRSCGYGVPFMEYKGVRPNLEAWVEKKGEEGVRQYWAEKNQYSVDGLPTNILKNA